MPDGRKAWAGRAAILIATLAAVSGTTPQTVGTHHVPEGQSRASDRPKPAGPEPSHFQYRALRAALDTETDPVRRRRLEVNLERWRAMPADLGPRYLIVNIPEAVLRIVIDDRVDRVHKVIVGKPATPTPTFTATVTGVVFNPTWSVPDSIIAESVGALVRSRPATARAKGYTWSRTASGRLRVVQRPGPGNALGEVKLDMPNTHRVYLHDTPSKELFAADRRTFSHGCVRVDDALALAAYLLDGSGWDRPRIDAALRTRLTERIELVPALPVHIVYLTAFADPDGTVRLIDDPYNLDAGIAAPVPQLRGSSPTRNSHPSSPALVKDAA